MSEIQISLASKTIRELHTGDTVFLIGVLATGRDAVHQWMMDTFINETRTPQGDDPAVYEAIQPVLNESLIYPCGPVVAGIDRGDCRFVAAGPTTSIREEPYQSAIMHHFNLRGVIGKGVWEKKLCRPVRRCRQPIFTLWAEQLP